MEQINNEFGIMVREYDNKRVITLKDIDKVHNRKEGTAKRNYFANKSRFVEGEDCYVLKKSLLGSDVWERLGFSKFSGTNLLLTDKGYYKIVKSLNDDLAWKVYDKIIKMYFKAINNQLDIPKENNELPTDRDKLLAMAFLEANKILNEQDEKIKTLIEESNHKDEIIESFVDDVDLDQKRQILNKIMRKGIREQKGFSNRWNKLYEQFSLIYHVNLNVRYERYIFDNGTNISKLEYIDKVLHMLNELYAVAVRLFETDVEKVKEQLFGYTTNLETIQIPNKTIIRLNPMQVPSLN